MRIETPMFISILCFS